MSPGFCIDQTGQRSSCTLTLRHPFFPRSLPDAGVSVYKDCVAEIALLCLSTGRQLSTLVRLPAGTNMSRQAEAVNNLSNAMLSAPGVPTFE